jgi:hypothetical protein
MVAYGTRAVSADNNNILADQLNNTYLVTGGFYAANQFAPLTPATTPANCHGVKRLPAGWFAARHRVFKWNGVTIAWEHCKGIAYLCSTTSNWQFSTTSQTIYAAPPTVVPALCGAGYYYADGQSWVWDGAAWQGGSIIMAPAGADYLNVTQSNYRPTAPPTTRARPGDQLRVIDSAGAPVLDKAGRDIYVVYDINAPKSGPGLRPTPAGFATSRTTKGGIEEVEVRVTNEQMAAETLRLESEQNR